MSSPSPRQRAVALLLSVVPGWGHVYWGRELLGMGIFTVAALCAFAWFNGVFVYRGAGRGALAVSAGVLLAIVVVVQCVELAWRTRPQRVAAEEKERERWMRDGTAAYLRGNLDAALECFRHCLRTRPQDVDALFRLGVVAARAGDTRAATRWLRRTTRYDLDDRWHWEIEREFAKLRRDRGSEERESSVDRSAQPSVRETREEEEAEPASA